MDDTLYALTFAAAILSGIMGGVFYAFSTAVMAALSRIPAPQGIAAMQSINLAVVNPLFMLALFGPALLSLVLGAAAIFGWGDLETGYVLAGSLIYLAGSIGVTAAFNIPRNNALAAIAPEGAESATYWTRFLSEWTLWNHVRTAACIAAMVAFVLALL